VEKRRVLEALKQFMAPLKLSRPLLVKFDECGGETRRFRPGDSSVTLCYELIERIEAIAAKASSPALREQVTLGATVQAVLTEVAGAVFDILHVPIWGRREDAADRLAALIMVNFGGDIADTTLTGTINFFYMSNKTWTGSAFAGMDSPEAQRFFNYACIAYGADSITFGWLVEPSTAFGGEPPLPRHRTGRYIDPTTGKPITYTDPQSGKVYDLPGQYCSSEYEQIRKSFNLRIMPYVDPNLLVRARAVQWLDVFAGK
jgi:hypothetical protein